MMLTIVKNAWHPRTSRTVQGLLLLVLAISLAGWCLTQWAPFKHRWAKHGEKIGRENPPVSPAKWPFHDLTPEFFCVFAGSLFLFFVEETGNFKKNSSAWHFSTDRMFLFACMPYAWTSFSKKSLLNYHIYDDLMPFSDFLSQSSPVVLWWLTKAERIQWFAEPEVSAVSDTTFSLLWKLWWTIPGSINCLSRICKASCCCAINFSVFNDG